MRIYKETLPSSLKPCSVRYIRMPEIGGLRRPKHDSINLARKNIGFRGYADYMQTKAEAAGRFLLAKPTRDKYIIHLEQRIVPQWGDLGLCEIKPDEVQQWLFKTCDSWHMMNDLRGIMSGVYTKAEEWGYWPEGRRNPISRVKIGEKWTLGPSGF